MEKLKPYAKAVVAVLTAVLVGLQTVLAEAGTLTAITEQQWITLIIVALGALGVYEIPNKSTEHGERPIDRI